MTEQEERVIIRFHHETGLTLEESEAILKGTGVAPLEEKED